LNLKEFMYNNSVKLQFGAALLFALIAQTPMEYVLSAGLLIHAILDFRDGRPL